MHNDKIIKDVADMLAVASKAHAKQSKMLKKILGSPVPRKADKKTRKNNGKKA